MIRVKKFTFIEYNDVLNTCDLMAQKDELNVYFDKALPSKLKQKFLDYGYIHYTDINKNVVTIKLSDSELREFYFLLGFSYVLAFTDLGDFVETDYVQILKERLTDYEDEYKKKLENRKPQTSEQLKMEELEQESATGMSTQDNSS